MRYVNVIVDLSASEVDRLFTYAVPAGMELLPGHQVAVPFGPRTIEGFVVSLSDETMLPPEKIKPVKRLVMPYPVILPEQMALAVWLKDRYLCNLVDALRLMIPAEMRGARVREKTARRVALAATGDVLAAFKESARAKRQLELVALLEQGEIESAKHPEYAQAIRALCEKGIARVYDAGVRRTPTALKIPDGAGDPILMPEQARAVDEIGRALDTGG